MAELRLNLADSYTARREYAQADALMSEAIQARTKNDGGASVSMLDARRRLAYLRLRAGQPGAALEAIRPAVRTVIAAPQLPPERFGELFVSIYQRS